MLNVNLLIVDNSYATNNTIENIINYIFRLNNNMHFIYGVFPPDKDKLIDLYEALRRYLPQNTCIQQVQHLIFSLKDSDAEHVDSLLQFSNQVAILISQFFPTCFALHDDTDNPHTHFVISTTSHLLNAPPFIDSIFEDFLKKIYALASNMNINLMGVKKHA